MLLADVRPGSIGAFPSYLTPLEPKAGGGERLFFLANGGGYDAAAADGLAQGWGGAQLWMTDGTASGTQRAFEQKTAGDFIPDRGSLDAGRPPRMAAFDGALYLPATEDPLVAVESLLGMHEVSDKGIPQVSSREFDSACGKAACPPRSRGNFSTTCHRSTSLEEFSRFFGALSSC